jgi:small acid-soluble spore protein F (minor alpha/beta-type SASP)
MMGKVMSEETKQKLANDLGFGDRTADGDWDDVTTGEVGSMVREAIKRGESKLAAEARLNGLAHQDEL